MTIFGGMKFLWMFFGGHHQIGLYLGIILCILGSFLKVKVQTEWGIFFGVAKISNIFWGFLIFLIFLGVNGRCWARTYV